MYTDSDLPAESLDGKKIDFRRFFRRNDKKYSENLLHSRRIYGIILFVNFEMTYDDKLEVSLKWQSVKFAERALCSV